MVDCCRRLTSVGLARAKDEGNLFAEAKRVRASSFLNCTACTLLHFFDTLSVAAGRHSHILYPPLPLQQPSVEMQSSSTAPLAEAEFEAQHVHVVYDQIATDFSRTRHTRWPFVSTFMSQLPAVSSPFALLYSSLVLCS